MLEPFFILPNYKFRNEYVHTIKSFNLEKIDKAIMFQN